MASEADSSSSFVGAGTRSAGAAVIARLDRIPIWSLSYLFIGIIGVGFLFTFFDIFDINVSFIQTCTQIVTGCLPGPPPGLTSAPPGLVLASDKLGLPVLLNLVGYVIGALILSPLADRFGRRDILLVTLVITGLGSLYTAFVGDYTNFIIARIITGIGVGADLALVATYINEVAPSNGRAKYTSLIFIMSSLGAFLGIWLGLWLTTPAANFPEGLPFALAQVQIVNKLPQFAGNGWRIMYGIGALLALVGIVLRFGLPESPRWLVARGRVVAVFDYYFGAALERKYWLPVAAVLTIVGGLIIAVSGSGNFWVTAIGAIILFIGFNLFVPMAWAWSAENYPTRARATGFALVDGIGHIGGGVGIIALAPLIPTMGAVVTFLVFGGILGVAAAIAQFGASTKDQRLDEVSP